MKIILTFHAKKRMIERNITIDNIRDVIELPDYIISRDKITEAYKIISGKKLNVVYEKTHNYIRIITLIWK